MQRNHSITPSRFFSALLLLLSCSWIVTAQLVPNLGGQRVGITSLDFLKIGVGGRAEGLGETFVAIANDATALYWNPAGIAQFADNQVVISHTEYVVDLKHDFLGVTHHLSGNDAVGFAITSLHTDDMPVTTTTQPFGTGEYFAFGDVAFGATYGRKMTDQFSFGITARYVEETEAILKTRAFMVDIGTFYWTGLGTSRFAVVVSNFGGDVSPSGEVVEENGSKVSSFQSFSPPTQFKIGFAMEPMELENQHITTSIELNHPNDNAENIHLGIEYEFDKTFWLRTGVKRTIGEPLFGLDNTSSNDVSFGVGLAVPIGGSRVNVDYAYANFHQLGNVQRISIGVTY